MKLSRASDLSFIYGKIVTVAVKKNAHHESLEVLIESALSKGECTVISYSDENFSFK